MQRTIVIGVEKWKTAMNTAQRPPVTIEPNNGNDPGQGNPPPAPGPNPNPSPNPNPQSGPSGVSNDDPATDAKGRPKLRPRPNTVAAVTPSNPDPGPKPPEQGSSGSGGSAAKRVIPPPVKRPYLVPNLVPETPTVLTPVPDKAKEPPPGRRRRKSAALRDTEKGKESGATTGESENNGRGSPAPANKDNVIRYVDPNGIEQQLNHGFRNEPEGAVSFVDRANSLMKEVRDEIPRQLMKNFESTERSGILGGFGSGVGGLPRFGLRRGLR